MKFIFLIGIFMLFGLCGGIAVYAIKRNPSAKDIKRGCAAGFVLPLAIAVLIIIGLIISNILESYEA